MAQTQNKPDVVDQLINFFSPSSKVEKPVEQAHVPTVLPVQKSPLSNFLPANQQANQFIPSNQYVQPQQVFLQQPIVQPLVSQPQQFLQQSNIVSQPQVVLGQSQQYRQPTTVLAQQTSQHANVKGESWFEQVPYERVYTEYVEKKVVEYVAVERKVTDYYTVENQIEYIPQVQYETIVEYVPVERVEERVEYQEMRRSLMHQQPIEQQQTIVQTVQAPVQYVQTVQAPVQYVQTVQAPVQYVQQPLVQSQVYTQPQVQTQAFSVPLVQQQAYTQQVGLPRQSVVQQQQQFLRSNSPTRVGRQQVGQFQDPNIKMTNSISLSKNKKQ